MLCNKCGTDIPEECSFCPSCGNSQGKAPVKDRQSNKKAKIILIAIVAIAVIGVVLKLLIGVLADTVFDRYEESADLKVTSACAVDSRLVYFTVKNTGTRDIRDFKLAYIGYDASGNFIRLSSSMKIPYDTIVFSTANVLPNETAGLGTGHYLSESDVKYIEATVEEITYKDGEVWKAKGLDSWAEKSAKEFSVDGYKRAVEGMQREAALAETTPYIEIDGSKKFADNRYSNSDDMEIYVTNVGDKVVKDISFVVLQYDENGYAIDVSPYGFVVANSRSVGVDAANLNPGQSDGWNWSLFFKPNCKDYKVIVQEIEFKDGDTWKNEYAAQWMLYNEDKR